MTLSVFTELLATLNYSEQVNESSVQLRRSHGQAGLVSGPGSLWLSQPKESPPPLLKPGLKRMCSHPLDSSGPNMNRCFKLPVTLSV